VVLVGAAPAVATAPLLFGLGGAGGSVAFVAGETLLQRTAPDEMLARVFGILEGLGAFALAIGSLAASGLIASLGTRVALILVGLLAPLIMLALWIPLSAIDRKAPEADPETLAFLRAMSIFAPLGPPAIERIANHTTSATAAPGEVLIREGEAGDRLLMIVEGRAEVTRGGAHVAERSAGEHVGEIALLRDVPRTATVTAVTEMRLLELERAPFLEAVTGHPQSHERAEAIVRDRLRT